MKVRWIACLLLLIILSLTACSPTEETANTTGVSNHSTAAPVKTDSTKPGATEQSSNSTNAASGTAQQSTRQNPFAPDSSKNHSQTETAAPTKAETATKTATAWVLQEKEGKTTGSYQGSEQKVTVPDGVYEITGLSDSVKELHLATSVQSIYLQDGKAINLQKITVNAQHPTFTAVNGILYNKEITEFILYPNAQPDKQYRIPDSIKELSFFPGGRFTEEIIVHKSLFVEPYGNNYSCPKNLKKVTVHKDNPHYSSVDGVFFNKNQTVLLLYPPAKTGTHYTVPSTVTKLFDWAFYYSTDFSFHKQPYLKTVALPPHITAIANTGLDIYDWSDEKSPEEVVQEIYKYLTFEVKKGSTTQQTLEAYGLNCKLI